MPMDLITEEDNSYGQNADKVHMPSLEQMPQTCFDQMTKDEQQ